jgi:hypothetical protein
MNRRQSVKTAAAGPPRAVPGSFAWMALVLALLLPPSAGHTELIDRVVASVNNDVITQSELNQAMGFNKAFSGGNDQNLRIQTLEGLINRRLLIQEAYRLKFVEVSEQEAEAEIEKLRKQLGPDKAYSDFLARLNLSPAQLRKMLGERLLVERFVEKKIGLYIRVSRDEAEAYYKTHQDQFKGKQFAEVQKAIVTGLSRQKLDEQMARYLTELRNKADIRER